jgi:diadenosine tetraphosphate (Ap4A) HIT family hydrolase
LISDLSSDELIKIRSKFSHMSFGNRMNHECLFCSSFQENRVKNLILFENTHAYSVFNYKPSVPGHSLIIPKRHIINLKKLKGEILDNFFQAIPLTFDRILELYEQQPEKISVYYKSLVASPPEPKSKEFALKMLQHPHLSLKPNSYNWGMNVGYKAGQREKHIHIHLFPRRENGLGIATAMRKHLKKQKP